MQWRFVLLRLFVPRGLSFGPRTTGLSVGSGIVFAAVDDVDLFVGGLIRMNDDADIEWGVHFFLVVLHATTNTISTMVANIMNVGLKIGSQERSIMESPQC